jgi:hypothetical protein
MTEEKAKHTHKKKKQQQQQRAGPGVIKFKFSGVGHSIQRQRVSPVANLSCRGRWLSAVTIATAGTRMYTSSYVDDPDAETAASDSAISAAMSLTPRSTWASMAVDTGVPDSAGSCLLAGPATTRTHSGTAMRAATRSRAVTTRIESLCASAPPIVTSTRAGRGVVG